MHLSASTLASSLAVKFVTHKLYEIILCSYTDSIYTDAEGVLMTLTFALLDTMLFVLQSYLFTIDVIYYVFSSPEPLG